MANQAQLHDTPVSYVNSGVKTKERVPKDFCRDCGREIYLDTDGDGRLVAVEKDGRRHPCPGA